MKFPVIPRSLLTLSLVAGIGQFANAQEPLSQVALFHRCYGQLTQLRPRLGDPLLAQVRSGAKNAIQACTEVLDRARFTADSGTKIQDDNDTIAKSVLSSMHQLHRSWAREQSMFNLGDGNTMLGAETWYDDSPLGSYVTRALFSPNFNVDSVTQGTDYPQPVRVTMAPPRLYRGVPNNVVNAERDFRLGADHPFAPRGDILGVRTVNIPPFTYLPVLRFSSLGALPNFNTIGVPPDAVASVPDVNFAGIDAVRGPIAETTLIAIRIRGQLIVPATANYAFYFDVDDGGQVYIDGTNNNNLVVSALQSGEFTGSRTLSAGTHTIEIRYRQSLADARMIFSWSSPNITRQVIPTSAFSNLQAEYFLRSSAPLMTIKLTGNEGGGFIGNHNYLVTTFAEGDTNYTPNGVERTNRSWARAVLADALCREIPVVREADVEQLVVPNSVTPYRQQAACTSCHASVDRQAGIIRGLRWNILSSPQQNSPLADLYGITGFRFVTPTQPELTTWSDIADNNYGARPPYGHLYFRNYRGELVDRVIRTFEELGTAIRSQDDYYACFAKRYYHYFLGINAELGDPGNPTYPDLNAAERHHLTKVIDLGTRLKSHKSLRQLVVDIISSDEYRMSDFGVSYQGSNP